MKHYKVRFKRAEGSPIYYPSVIHPLGVEKIMVQTSSGYKPVPIVKGSHTRGKFRRWLAKQIMLRNLHQIKDLPDFNKRVSIITALYYSGSLVKGISLNADSLLVQKFIEEKDKFGKYFGYMITGVDNKRSLFFTGHLIPDVDFDKIEIHTRIEKLGDKYVELAEPLTTTLSGRKAGIISEVASLFKDDEKLPEIIADLKALLSKQTNDSKDDKEDTENILQFEVINSGFDMVQDLYFYSDNEDEIKGILTAYYKYFNEVDKTIGGNSSKGYGLLKGIEIEGFEPDERAYEEYISSIDIRTLSELINYNLSAETKREKRERKKEK